MSYNDQTETVTLVAAVDEAMAIGKDGVVPWRLKADMDHFKNLTMGHPVVIGRKTYEVSIPEKYRPLPGRENWILTRDSQYSAPGCRVFHDAEEVLRAGLGRDIFVIGGGEVYKLFLPHATRIILTHVETVVGGADAFFPELPTNWSQRIVGWHAANPPDNVFDFSIVEYRRVDEF